MDRRLSSPEIRVSTPAPLLALLAALACSSGQDDRPAERGPASAAGAPSAATGDVALDPRALGSAEPAVREAAAALERGRPYAASRALDAVVRDPARRSPGVMLLAARAAAAWGGWSRVEQLLANERWLDAEYGGEGRVLLARAALERRADTLALRHALASVRATTSARERGIRLVLAARSLDRLDLRDSAAATYRAAAAALPDAADWLRLRAAGVTADSAGRAGDYAALTTATARGRVDRTEALARERTGDAAGAARAYAALGDQLAALRLRVALAQSAGDRAAVRRDLVALVERRGGTSAGASAVALLDEHFAPLTPAEELLAARSLAASGSATRAATAFARADAAKPVAARDRFAWGSALFRAGRFADAAREFARVGAPADLAARARYQRARALLRGGNAAAARTTLRALVSGYPRETEPAADALFLLADLATDDARDADARAAFRELAAKYPSARRAPEAAFRAAIIAIVRREHAAAASELDALRARWPSSDEAVAATYWAGRAHAAAGSAARARERWRAVMERDPLSYYAGRAAARLDTTAWVPPAAADEFPAIASVDAAFRRADLLGSLGMDVEARAEYDQLVREAEASVDRLLATADAFRDRGLTSRSIQLGWRAIGKGAPKDARSFRLVYPVAQREVIAAEARANRLEPALVAALIRQESSFNPRATSRVGARGLMQLMPGVGTAIARGRRLPHWDPVLLYQPDVNVTLGTAHLRGLVARYPNDLEKVFAAYNAGDSRVARWRRKAGADDREVFVERIPYEETRDYVRILMRNRELYRALYEW